MTKVICLSHKDYSGTTLPDVSCKVCCNIYVDILKQRNVALKNRLSYCKEKQKAVVERRIMRREAKFDSSCI